MPGCLSRHRAGDCRRVRYYQERRIISEFRRKDAQGNVVESYKEGTKIAVKLIKGGTVPSNLPAAFVKQVRIDEDAATKNVLVSETGLHRML